MGVTSKPSEKAASFASAEDALRAEGPVGEVSHKAFNARLQSDDVREKLASVRAMWMKLYGRDPFQGQAK